MKVKIREISLVLAAALLVLSLTACAELDVIGKGSIASFDQVLDALGDRVTIDERTGGWMLPAPDDSVAFIWVPDYSKSGKHDIMLVYDGQPFLDAGLDVDKLPETYTVIGDKLIMGIKLGNDALTYEGDPTPLASYRHIVDLYPDVISYHAALDHFGVMIHHGTMFEWAKDMSTNDKDIVFVLNPAPLIKAGVDPEAVEGWVYGKVKTHAEGTMTEVEVDRFLKPFDLR